MTRCETDHQSTPPERRSRQGQLRAGTGGRRESRAHRSAQTTNLIEEYHTEEAIARQESERRLFRERDSGPEGWPTLLDSMQAQKIRNFNPFWRSEARNVLTSERRPQTGRGKEGVRQWVMDQPLAYENIEEIEIPEDGEEAARPLEDGLETWWVIGVLSVFLVMELYYGL